MEDVEIRKAGLKVTVPRLKILEVLEKCGDQHVSAEDVYKILIQQGEEISLATIYRVLTQFETAQLVIRHNFEGGFAVFELNRGEHHDHILCVVCGKVVEFTDDVIEQRQLEIAKEMGFEIEDHSLVIYGRCNNPECKMGKA
ncbi:MAG: ferric iron uptake transcriptional regulator [Gammaproteobacteria bacterium]|nr:ferric iron uptake transcriptional regulator [Gammaproteobacteria bacterium]